MAKKGSKILLTVASLLVLTGIGIYAFSQYRKKRSEGGDDKSSPDTDSGSDTGTQQGKQQTGGNTGTGGNTVSGRVPDITQYLNATYLVAAFQDWLDKNYPNWYNGTRLNKGSGYGTLGPKTKAAWQKYGAAYANVLARQGSAIDQQNKRQAAMAAFPIGKQVMARDKFRAYAVLKRNDQWMSTDTNGYKLPSKEFLATADLGKVYAQEPATSTLIIQLNQPIEQDGKGYPLVRVNTSWVK